MRLRHSEPDRLLTFVENNVVTRCPVYRAAPTAGTLHCPRCGFAPTDGLPERPTLAPALGARRAERAHVVTIMVPAGIRELVINAWLAQQPRCLQQHTSLLVLQLLTAPTLPSNDLRRLQRRFGAHLALRLMARTAPDCYVRYHCQPAPVA